MNLRELQDILHRRPFVPFHVFVSDGAVYDVRHPELCVPGRSSVFIGRPAQDAADESPVYDRFAIVDLDHITRLEPIDTAANR